MTLKNTLSGLAGHPRAFDDVLDRAGLIILGKDHEIRLAIACLLANGHLLIEDLPGMGKTTLAHTLARLLGLQFSRIQFTSDLLPADITGVSVFEQDKSDFRFLPGATTPTFDEWGNRTMRCSKRWRNARSPPRARPARCPSPSSS